MQIAHGFFRGTLRMEVHRGELKIAPVEDSQMNNQVQPLCVCLMWIIFPVGSFAETASFEDVVARYELSIAQIKDYSVEYLNETEIHAPLGANVIDDTVIYNQAATADKVFRDKKFVPKGGESVREQVVDIYNGEYQYSIRPPAGRAVEPELSILPSRVEEPFLGPEQIYSKHPCWNQLLFSSILRSLSGPEVDDIGEGLRITGKFNVGRNERGEFIALAEDVVEFAMVIAKDTGLPMQYESRFALANNPFVDSVKDIEYINKNGVYFPIYARRDLSVGVTHIYKANVEQIHVNEGIPSDLFIPKMEPGTFVWDYIMNVQYKYMPKAFVKENVARIEEILDDPILSAERSDVNVDVAEMTPAPSLDDSESGMTSSLNNGIMAAIAVLAIAIGSTVGGFYCHRKWKRNPRRK